MRQPQRGPAPAPSEQDYLSDILDVLTEIHKELLMIRDEIRHR